MQAFSYIKIKKVDKASFSIHCIQAPEEGEMVNAQLIETENKLLLIDTLQLKPHAEELRQYIESIGKPLDRVIITHHHPDHWFGAISFRDSPLYAFPEVIGIINTLADFLLDYHRSLHPENPDVIPTDKVTPSEVLNEGEFELDGLKLNFIKVLDTECPINLVIEIPEEKILLAQDLVYNKVYPYFGERTQAGEYSFDNWIRVLQEFQAKNYVHVLPGHGDPTDSSIFSEMIEYLKFAKQKVAEGLRGEDLIGAIQNQFPDYGLPLTLHMSNYMLFVFQNQ